jgi:hypothetical protein
MKNVRGNVMVAGVINVQNKTKLMTTYYDKIDNVKIKN